MPIWLPMSCAFWSNLKFLTSSWPKHTKLRGNTGCDCYIHQWPFHHGTIVSPAPGGDSSVVVVKYPLYPHHKALGLFGQHSIIYMSEAHLLLIVVDLNLHQLLLKRVHPILILVLKVSLEALDTEVTLKKIREEKYNTFGLRVPF